MIFKKFLFLGTTHASVFDFKQCYIQGIICPVMTNSSFRSGKRLNILPISRIFNDHNPNSSTFEGLEFSFAISRTFQDFIYFLIIYLVTSFITYFAHSLIYLPKSYYLNLLAQPLTHSVTQLLACVADSCKHPCTQSDLMFEYSRWLFLCNSIFDSQCARTTDKNLVEEGTKLYKKTH